MTKREVPWPRSGRGCASPNWPTARPGPATPTTNCATPIRNTALQYQLVSNYTSFVAVDSMLRTAGGHGVTVHQAVPVPDGVRYETTVD